MKEKIRLELEDTSRLRCDALSLGMLFPKFRSTVKT